MKAGSQLFLVSTLLTSFSWAQAAENTPFELSANVAMTTDYVWRGFSQSEEEAAIQGGFDINHESGVYLGTWSSSVDFAEDNPADRASTELDFYLGYASELPSGGTYDIGYIYYSYPGAGEDLNYDFDEFTLSLGYAIENTELGFGYAYAREFFGDVDSAHHFELSAAHDLGNGFGLGGHIGRQTFSDNELAGDDYTHYGLSLSYTWMAIDIALAYNGTDVDDVDIADDRLFLTVSKTF